MQTLNLSPKAIAAGITGYVAPLLVGYLATKLDVKVDVNTTTALLLPLVTAAVTFAASYLAKPGAVYEDVGEPNDLLIDREWDERRAAVEQPKPKPKRKPAAKK